MPVDTFVLEFNDGTSEDVFRGLRHAIECRCGYLACLAFGEAVVNALVHSGGPCRVTLSGRWAIVEDHGPGIGRGITDKPNGEGGYGLRIIRSAGGVIKSDANGTVVYIPLCPEEGHVTL